MNLTVRQKNQLIWLAENGLFGVAVWLAIFKEVSWLQPLIVTFLWFVLLLYAAVAFQKGPPKTVAYRYVPRWVHHAVDLPVVAVLVYGEWYLSAIVWIAQIVCLQRIHERNRTEGPQVQGLT